MAPKDTRKILATRSRHVVRPTTTAPSTTTTATTATKTDNIITIGQLWNEEENGKQPKKNDDKNENNGDNKAKISATTSDEERGA